MWSSQSNQSRFNCNNQFLEEIWSENLESSFVHRDLALTILTPLASIMGELKALPAPSELSPSVLSFLDRQLYNNETLAQAPALVTDLQNQCHELNLSLLDLNRSLGHTLLSHSSFSDRLHGLLGDVNGKLVGLESLTRALSSTQGLCSLLARWFIHGIMVSCMVLYVIFRDWDWDLCSLICYRIGNSWWGPGEGAIVAGKRSGENGDGANVRRWVTAGILPCFLPRLY